MEDIMLTRSLAAAAFVLGLGVAAPCLAQSSGSLPLPAAEVQSGWVGFVDESSIDHMALGGAARWYLTPRLAIGPEVGYLRGPGNDRDVMVTMNMTYDMLSPRDGRPRRVTPFIVVGGGFEQLSDRIGSLPFTSYEGAFTMGAGTRVWFTDRVYGMVETRIGWEPHARLTGGIGIALR
jgi:hypothetical protein